MTRICGWSAVVTAQPLGAELFHEKSSVRPATSFPSDTGTPAFSGTALAPHLPEIPPLPRTLPTHSGPGHRCCRRGESNRGERFNPYPGPLLRANPPKDGDAELRG